MQTNCLNIDDKSNQIAMLAGDRPNKWLQFLADTIGNDAIVTNRLQGFAGWCLNPDRSVLNQTLVLHGHGFGKFEILRVMANLAGIDNFYQVLNKIIVTRDLNELDFSSKTLLIHFNKTSRNINYPPYNFKNEFPKIRQWAVEGLGRLVVNKGTI